MGSQGRLSSVEVRKESTWGTDPGGSGTTIPLRSATLDEDSVFKDYDDLHQSGTGVTRGRAELARDAGGTTSALLGYSAIGLMLEAVFGSNATTGAGPYTHTFTHSDPGSLPSYTLVMRWGSSSYLRTLTGCKAAKGTLKWKAREYSVLDIEWIAEDVTSFTSGTPGTPSIANYCLPNHSGVVGWNAASYTNFVSMDWIVDHQLERTPVIGNLKTQEPEPGGRTMVRVEWTARLTAAQYASMFTAYKGGTRSDLTMTLTSGSESLAMSMDNAQITKLRADPSAPGPMLVSGTFEGTADGTGSDGIHAVLTNANASYTT